MKYIVLIMDGASGNPIPDHRDGTALSLATKVHLNALAKKGTLGLTQNVPEGMEPSSAIACLSVLGYDPRKSYSGRGPIEALALGITLNPGEVAFRCNLVTLADGNMQSYCCGHITDGESHALIATLNEKLGDDRVRFYPGVSYRHILVVKKGGDLLSAECTPPHDISDKPASAFRPKGTGARFLDDLMRRSERILKNHPVNKARIAAGKLPATSAWLFWGGAALSDLSSFESVYKVKACLTSGVDLLRGLARLTGIEILDIKGVTGGLDTDYTAQIEGALNALDTHDLVVVHVESPDEAGHMGSLPEKIKAIEETDAKMVSRILQYDKDAFRLLVLPDHPTPVSVKTHTSDPVPFLLYGPDIDWNSGAAYTEIEAESTGFIIPAGQNLMGKLIFS
ncbi:MAG: cofactor-independent phosphoglycerate mutase [Fibrobacterota bacterium]